MMPALLPMDFDNPVPDMISLDEIVHRLTRQSRWAGNFEPVSYTVAQHSMIVASACKLPASRPYALLYDTAKGWKGDLSSGLKHWLSAHGADVRAVDRRILQAVWAKFGLSAPSQAISSDIYQADERACATEYRDIVHFRHPNWTPWVPPLSMTVRFKPQPKIEEELRLAIEVALCLRWLGGP